MNWNAFSDSGSGFCFVISWLKLGQFIWRSINTRNDYCTDHLWIVLCSDPMYLRVCLTSAACLHTSGLRSPEFKRDSELQLGCIITWLWRMARKRRKLYVTSGIFVAPVLITITTFHLWQAIALIPDGCWQRESAITWSAQTLQTGARPHTRTPGRSSGDKLQKRRKQFRSNCLSLNC